MTVENRDLMTRLREDTRPMHDAAEQQPFMMQLMSGSLKKETFLEAVKQLAHLHLGLAKRIETLRLKSETAAKVIHDYHMNGAQCARSDLKFWDLDLESSPANPGVQQFLSDFDHYLKESPDAALGMVYVIEGSNNGAQILKRKFKEVLGQEAEGGLAMQDPHGAELRPRWGKFVADMNAQGFDQPTQDKIVEAAGKAFTDVGQMYRDIAS